MPAPKTLLVTTVKNEGPNILEWVAHHKLVGFDVIQVYQNDSDDETSKHLRTLARAGVIEYYRNPSNKRQWQNKAYRRASFSSAYAECDWCMALDGDEFLNVRGGTVQDLIARCDGADEIIVNWKMFGSSGHTTLSDDLVTERYQMAEPADAICDVVRGFKTLFRTADYRRPGIHLPKIPQREGIRIKNASGLENGTFRRTHWRSTDPSKRKFAQINHYAVRDAASFLLKSVRGSASHPDRDISLKYWNKFNLNAEADLSLAQHSARLRAKMAELDALSDGRLSFLRENSLRLWREKIDHVLKTPEGRDLYDAICQHPPVSFTSIEGDAAGSSDSAD